MSIKKQLIKRVFAILLIIFGLVFGGTWSRTQFCLGDNIFSTLGLPAWSNGTSGTHYSAIAGLTVILIGLAVLNSTLSKKSRPWACAIGLVILVIVGLAFAYI